MYIIKNALRCIGRSKARNVLIAIIVLVIAVSACLGLSIRQAAVPVTNALLANQSTSQQNRFDAIEQNFGRGEMPGGMGGGMPQMPGGSNRFEQAIGSFGSTAEEAITEITSATDFTVLLQMLGIAVLLTLVAGAVSMLFIMRYEPLKILSNRD